jgi:hypothetical protein
LLHTIIRAKVIFISHAYFDPFSFVLQVEIVEITAVHDWIFVHQFKKK